MVYNIVMSKKVLIICLVGVLLVSIFAACTSETNETKTMLDDMANWMSYISDDAYITKIAIPGSHDAISYGTTIVSAKTQGGDLTAQLKSGCRYFDLRFATNKSDNNELYGVHAVVMTNVKAIDALTQCKDFIVSHPSEFLILDLSQFRSKDTNCIEKIKVMVKELFVDTSLAVLKNGENIDEYVSALKLKDVRGKVIITFGEKADENYLFRRNNDAATVSETCALRSDYIGEKHSQGGEVLANETMPYYLDNLSDDYKGFFVLQSQLTNGALDSIENKENAADEYIKARVSSFKENESYLSKVNIVMRDYISDVSKDINIVELNISKGIVK